MTTRPLLLSRRFAPLFWCQFFSAFNDNFLKTALVFLILFGNGGGEALITLASAVFIAPYFFLSALGGELADRFDKGRVARSLKLIEIGVCCVAIAGFLLHSVPVLFVALFGFGVLAALFGPLKYGILPDQLSRTELPAGNALVEGATFIAILTGTIAGGIAGKGGAVVIAGLLLAFAIASWLASLLIPPTGERAPRLRISANILRATRDQLRYLRGDSRLFWGALVTSWFWAAGIVVLAIMPPLIKTLVGGNEDAVTVYLAVFSIAVGAGSWLAAYIARGRIVLRTTLIGALSLGLFTLDLGVSTLGMTPGVTLRGPGDVFVSFPGLRVAFDLAGLALAGGLFIVPAFAAVQAWSDQAHRARTVAAVNILNATFMTAATILTAVLQRAGVTVPQLFVLLGIVGLVVAYAIKRTMPRAG
ncbi:MAG: MFS transporter [Pseudolabrys sp.]|nr:MFS transporter [Pseudolabrys sp.]